MIRPLRSTRITRLLRYYETVCPRAPQRYSTSRGDDRSRNSLSSTTDWPQTISGRQVPTFHAKARVRLAPPICRTPPGQYTGIPQTYPEAQLVPRFRRHCNHLRHIVSGSLTLAFLTHT